ncbi:NTP pyrophosphohydrolase [Lactobacillus nasalidis]|uniref:NAD(+) diphosphatase n=1 Tax=Lactobacillus nasalidis TaxID=2797258 RepID=A0ABQ3W635_9LACO|nr:NUDIX domain-containing protein [Lactobacillus nasalidis]GHV97615.1 NTP pyrophosphohydrolase [Lactobacillus nasalidis]GHW00074.1 NTP pyrophosphohydrolase [Lactobacillus nasalidis]GHW00779.1 NTP pyrophosphohydrolase [Lactobacillus nasalidis]
MFELNYCPQCGQKLVKKELPLDGWIPYCENCRDFRFPIFSVAVSMIVMTEARDRVLLIKQYGRDAYVLVAGYVSKGENAEDTCQRELMEELGLKVKSLHFNRSQYFAPSNTLMLNYTVVVDEGEKPRPNDEIDAWSWLDLPEARRQISQGSLAQEFLEGYLLASGLAK